MKTRSGIADLDTAEGKATTDDQKAEALNSFFISVFTREDTSSVPSASRKPETSIIRDLNITKAAVEEKLKKLNPSKSSGPDGLHPRILWELREEISGPLAAVMQKSLEEGHLPQAWKDAHVSPIFKKGKRNLTNNYRPVSLTSVVCKTLESIIRDHVMEHIEENKLLTNYQHGFVSGRSCSTQLLACLDRWTEILDSGSVMDAVYLDFSKAFDSVPHHRLCTKLEAYGIQGSILTWLTSFLANRRQKVVVNGRESKWENVLSGVPQGSVIGPILFIIFINDMPEAVNSFIQMFADDAKLFAETASVEQRTQLQEDLNALLEWSRRWQLVFNAKKCKVMHLGRDNIRQKYSMQEEELEVINCEKDLGVWVDDELKFDEHTEIQSKKANRILGLIRRTFSYIDKDSFCVLYKSLVRVHLEYANAVTYPQYERDAKLLENVQRRATKLVPSIRELDYVDRLKALKLPSLLYRRQRGDMIEAYKFTHGLYQVNPSPLHLDTNNVTRGHSYKLKKSRSSKAVRQKFFSQRIVNSWNSLPEPVVDSPTVNTFKNRLDKHWADKVYEIPNL
jgi:hypothetical protein